MSSEEPWEGEPPLITVTGLAVGTTFSLGVVFGVIFPVVGIIVVVLSCCAFVILATLAKSMGEFEGYPCVTFLNWSSIVSFSAVMSIAAVVFAVLGIVDPPGMPRDAGGEEWSSVVFCILIIVSVPAVWFLRYQFVPPYYFSEIMTAKQEVCTVASVLVPTGPVLFVQVPYLGGLLFVFSLLVFAVLSWGAGFTWWFWVQVKVRLGRYRDPLQFVPVVVIVIGDEIVGPGTDDPGAEMHVIDDRLVALGPGDTEIVPMCTYFLLHERGLRARASRREATIEREVRALRKRERGLGGWRVLR